MKLTMKSYLEEAIQAFGENVSVGAVTPASRNLFIVNNNLPLLETERAEIFHHVVAKLLYVAKRARVDIQLAIAFYVQECRRAPRRIGRNYAGF